MKKGFAYVALSALTLAAPASAERLYVPVLETAGADGSVFATRVRAGGEVLAQLSPAQKTGLIPVEIESEFEVSAWAVDRAGREITEVPVFSEAETYTAGVDVQLGELPRPRAMASLQIGAANLSEQTAFCKASLYGRRDNLLAEVPFEVEPMSLAKRDGLAAAGRGRVSYARVTCDQSFYPFAVTAGNGDLRPTIAKGVGPNGACTYTLDLIKDSLGNYTAVTQAGEFHNATKANPKGIICLKAPGTLNIAKAVYEWDVVAGPWSTRDRSGLHNLGYFFLERFRSGTVGNINIAGPNKSFLKFAQNVGMPPPTNTNTKAGFTMQKDLIYHVAYTFDAHNKLATLQVFQNGVELKKLTKEVKPGNNQTLVVKPFGQGKDSGLAMIAEFGNYLGQHHPEEASIGWQYRSFKLTMTPKK
jgi:hypothetical protein